MPVDFFNFLYRSDLKTVHKNSQSKHRFIEPLDMFVKKIAGTENFHH